MNSGFFDHPNKNSLSRVVSQAMPYWQHRNRFKNNHWEQEKFNDCYPKEHKCIGYATPGHLATSHSHHRQQTKYTGPGGWTDKVTEFHSYNKAGRVGDGHQYTQMPGGGHRHDYGTNERKEGKRTFATQNGGHGMMMSEHQQKRRRMGYSNNHGCSSHSDSESESDEDSDDCNDFEEKLTVHNMTPKLKSSKRSYHIISNMNSYS